MSYNQLNERIVKLKLAVDMRNVVFGYSEKIKILDEMNIAIPEGKIYALLGSNGCGKTSLLRLILGIKKPQSGYIRVFGVEPGSKQSDIPGSGVGYMPQDIALFTELTIEETLIYYGIIYHMKSEDIQQRIKDLTELLNLPKKHSKIYEISGGQQRLVSMAVTMIHRPRLLILDEPTVGVDSLLRFRIWQYLENICRKEGTTVIITTHYIEETKTASTVAFMKMGKLLTQSNPNDLLLKHKCKTLEEVFFELCLKKNREQKNESNSFVITENQNHSNIWDEIVLNDRKIHKNKKRFIDFDHMRALLWKCFVRVKRNPLAILLFFSIPVIQITAMSLSIGQKIYKLPVAIHNAEIIPELSDLFISKIDEKYINYKIYDMKEPAIDSVVKGENWIALSFSENFSDCLKTRFLDQHSLTDEDIQFSEIRIHADMSNFVIGFTILRSLLDTFQNFMQNFSSTQGFNPFAFSSPIDYQQLIYGSTELTFDKFLSPGITISTLHAMPMIFAAFLIILEKKSGHLERAFVSGIKPIEFLLSQMIQLFIAILSQVFVSMFVLFVIFDTQLNGSILEVFSLFVLQGLQGMSFGILIAIVCDNEIYATGIVSAIILPLWLCSGIIWPLEAIPRSVSAVLYWTPLTQPIESMRSIMLRGWSISNTKVQLGFAVSLTYTIIATVINLSLI